ncbi:MAG: hypothetical protein A2W91_18215 [Bacteroidetes bacterium GWF2_38_335]|nr:MAG: hypothetical protein A2W91_18215 [Bacteroidetes bacterium GWF2_38_335]OFY80099.1 MAG: hypothetical protein A2281_12425 [Bacteroidetes bacterium RIFOXYA12_FULL_38_20]HBS88575.1 rhomboid family intramembrane serine protease [Bacteroidales bacterium]
MASIADEIKENFKSGSMLTKLLYINIGVFVVSLLVRMVYYLYDKSWIDYEFDFVRNIAIPSDPDILLNKPWTVFTHMFAHIDLLHILFNMLWLYWFGKIFLHYLDGKKMLGLYLMGGLAGALVYIVSFNVFPVFEKDVHVSVALGASSAVFAIIVAVAMLVPDQKLYLLFFGPVKIKYIALVSIAIGTIIGFEENTGGKLGHIGGVILGYLYMLQYKKGRDISKGFLGFFSFFGKPFRRRKKMKVTYKSPPRSDYDYNADKAKKQERMNLILDKISKSGYNSLTKEEKEILFKMSNRN